MAVDLYAALAVLSRASSSVRARGSEKAAEEIRLAQAFVLEAKYRVVGNLKEMEKNRDRARAAVRDGERNANSETVVAAGGYRFDYW